MTRTVIKRWSKISLRTLHLLGVAGVGGGILFALEKSLWINYWWLVLTSGTLLMLVNMFTNRVWIVQLRGLAIVVKLVLLAFLGSHPDWDSFLLAVIIIMSAVISHAPGKLRYYSVYHRMVINSDDNSNG